jgi:hypothetical protein
MSVPCIEFDQAIRQWFHFLAHHPSAAPANFAWSAAGRAAVGVEKCRIRDAASCRGDAPRRRREKKE